MPDTVNEYAGYFAGVNCIVTEDQEQSLAKLVYYNQDYVKPGLAKRSMLKVN